VNASSNTNNVTVFYIMYMQLMHTQHVQCRHVICALNAHTGA